MPNTETAGHTPRCAKCGSNDVRIYEEANPLCPECCPDHDYKSDGGEIMCQWCGALPPHDYFDSSPEDDLP